MGLPRELIDGIMRYNDLISKRPDYFFTYPHFSRTYFSSIAFSAYLYFLLISELL